MPVFPTFPVPERGGKEEEMMLWWWDAHRASCWMRRGWVLIPTHSRHTQGKEKGILGMGEQKRFHEGILGMGSGEGLGGLQPLPWAIRGWWGVSVLQEGSRQLFPKGMGVDLEGEGLVQDAGVELGGQGHVGLLLLVAEEQRVPDDVGVKAFCDQVVLALLEGGRGLQSVLRRCRGRDGGWVMMDG